MSGLLNDVLWIAIHPFIHRIIMSTFQETDAMLHSQRTAEMLS